jgi:PPM family protein phosphatase
VHTDVAGLTHVGMKRNHNEDNLLALGEQGIFVVADGMGGHASGEVASRVAVEEVASFYIRSGSDGEGTWPYQMDLNLSYDENRLLTAIRLANVRIFELASTEARYKKMGTTIVALSLGPAGVLLAHVGDSRGYRLRASTLQQLTEDHSLLNDYKKAKPMTAEEIAKFPHKNVISRALGMGPDVKVDIDRDTPLPGDIYLLCSDGLSGMLPDPEIARLLNLNLALDLKARALVDAANAAGGADNITAILVRIS